MSKNTSSAEGTAREKLATYFLSAPAFGEQTPAQRKEFFENLRQMGELENREVLQTAGHARPLVWGNPVPLVQNLLTASQRLAAKAGQPVLVFPAKETAIDFQTMLHPRIFSLGVLNLLRAACTAAPRRPVWVRLHEQENSLSVTVTADQPFYEPQAAAIAKETARLHGGSLAVSDNTIGFSCERTTQWEQPMRPYICPSAGELYRDTLSPVWTGFYCWISSGGSDDSG